MDEDELCPDCDGLRCYECGECENCDCWCYDDDDWDGDEE